MASRFRCRRSSGDPIIHEVALPDLLAAGPEVVEVGFGVAFFAGEFVSGGRKLGRVVVHAG